jgi:hypothetical protein
MAQYTFDHAFQKDVYVIINGFREFYYKIPPSRTYWNAGHLIADTSSKYGNPPSEYYTYFSDIDCVIDRSIDLSSSEGCNLLGQFYDFLVSRGWTGGDYPSGISPYAIPFMREINLFGHPSGYNMIRKQEIVLTSYTNSNTPGTPNFDVKLPFYISPLVFFYKDGVIKETESSRTYSESGFFRESVDELYENIFIDDDDYVNNKPKDGTVDYWINDGSGKFRLNRNQISLVRAGVFGKEEDEGISFFLLNYQYVPPYKGSWTENNVMDLVGIIHTEAFLYILYGFKNYIKFVQVYQRKPNFISHIDIGTTRYYVVDNISDITSNSYTFVGTFISPHQEGSIGINIKYIYPFYVVCEFYNKILGENYSSGVHKSIMSKLPEESLKPIDLSPSALNVRSGTRRNPYVMSEYKSALRIPYPYIRSNRMYIVDPSKTVRLYLNAYNNFAFFIGKPAYSQVQKIITGDKFTSFLYNFENSSVEANIGKIYESIHFNKLETLSYRIYKRRPDKWVPADINTPIITVDDERDYVVNTDLTELPTNQKLPVYRIGIDFKAVEGLYSGLVARYLKMFTVPVPVYSITFVQAGIYIDGYLRVPSKIVIRPDKILNISINRGSVFEEHAQVSIWSEDGEFDFLKQMVEYNVLIVADYTREKEISNDPDLTFINNIPAGELGIPDGCVVIFRGFSDFENPISYKVQRLQSSGGFRRQEVITLNIQGVFHRIKQMVPIVAESFNSYTHIDAIKDILYRGGVNVDTDFIYDRNSPDADVILMPPIPTYNTGYVIEPPNTFGDLIRKIVNEFSGWWFFYRHIDGKFYYIDKRFRIPTEDYYSITYFYATHKHFTDNYFIRPSRVVLYNDVDVRVIRPVATQIILYGGSTYPLNKTDYVAVNRRAVEDPTYEFYIGRNIPVWVYSPITFDRVLRLILRNLSYRMLIGHKVANIRFYGIFGTGMFNPCFIEGLGYGIIKSASTDYNGSTKILQSEAEVELVNYVDENNNQYAIFWDEL